MGLERGPLSLESTIEELIGRESSGSGLENRDYGRWKRCVDHSTSSISKRCHYFGRQAAVARSVQYACGLMPRSLFVCLYVMVIYYQRYFS
jgi:hypothetical protein